MKKINITKKIKKNKEKKKKIPKENSINSNLSKNKFNQLDKKLDKINKEEISSNNIFFEILDLSKNLLFKINEIEKNLFSEEKDIENKEETVERNEKEDKKNDEEINNFHKNICESLKEIATPSMKSKIFEKLKIIYGTDEAMEVMKIFNSKDKTKTSIIKKDNNRGRGRPPVKSKIFDPNFYKTNSNESSRKNENINDEEIKEEGEDENVGLNLL